MNLKVLLIVFLLIITTTIAYSTTYTEIDSCVALSDDTYYTLNTSIVETNNCFDFNDNFANITIDLGGFTLEGPTGTNRYGFMFRNGYLYQNITIKNGHLEGWAYPILDPSGSYTWTSGGDVTVRNLSFNGSEFGDIYFYAHHYGNNFTLINNTFANTVTFEEFQNIILINNSFKTLTLTDINSSLYSSNNIYNSSVTSIDTFEFSYLTNDEFYSSLSFAASMGNVEIDNSYLYDCSNDFSNADLVSGTLYLGENLICDNEHFLSLYVNLTDFIFNLNGYNLTSINPTNKYAFYFGATGSGYLYDNVTIKNGNISGWTYTLLDPSSSNLWISGSSLTLENLTLYNPVFSNLLFTGIHTGSNLTLKNSYLDDAGTLEDFNYVSFYGNNLSSGSDFTFNSIGNLNFSYNISTNYLGNYWRDITCSDSLDNYSVVYNGFNYTVCNSNDYSSGSVTDIAPWILKSEIISGGEEEETGGESSSGVSLSRLLPANSFISIFLVSIAALLFTVFN